MQQNKDISQTPLQIVVLDSVPSTNSYALEHRHELTHNTLILALEQTYGRGQRGNSWYMQQGDLALSLLYHHPAEGLPMTQFYAITEVTSLAIVAWLKEYEIAAQIKWPNDILINERKVCGILVENCSQGHKIQTSVIGVGVNFIQKKHIGVTPWPITTLQDYIPHLPPVKQAGKKLGQYILHGLQQIPHTSNSQRREAYLQSLYRTTGEHQFEDCTGIFYAKIDTVLPDGTLCMIDRKGHSRQYLFKEVRHIW